MKPIVCRVNPRFWWLVVAGTIEAIFFIVGPSLDSSKPKLGLILMSGAMGVLFLVALAWIASDLVRGEIRADDEGLHWRRAWGRSHFARWEEISDFYVRVTSDGTHFVETPDGKLDLSRYFTGIEEIIALVPVRAVKVRHKVWEKRGFRPDEAWTESLPLWSKSQQWTAPSMTFALLFCGLLIFILSRLEPSGSKPSLGFFWFDIFPLIMAVLFFGSLGLGFLWMMASLWRERKFAWQHRAHRLTLDSEGLLFEDENERVKAKWDEVQRVEEVEREVGHGRYRVVTEGGDFVLWRLRFSGEMCDKFLARCQSYAPDALESWERQSEGDQSLDFELNPAPTSAEGEQTFSFRTRNNRLIVGTIGAVLGLAPLLYLIQVYNSAIDQPFAPSWPLFGALCATAILISGALLLWFTRALIVAAPDGLRVHWPLRAPRTVRWASISEVGADVWGDWVRADGGKIYWALGLVPARRGELRALIEEKRAAGK